MKSKALHGLAILAIFFICLQGDSAIGQKLSIDSSFSSDGIIPHAAAYKGLFIHNYDDDRVLHVIGGDLDTIILSRYLANGTPDPSFGQNGISKVSVPGLAFLAQIAVQPDQKIVGVGNSNLNFGGGEIILFRVLSNGTSDNSFNGTGYLKHHPAPPKLYTVTGFSIDTFLASYKYYVSSTVGGSNYWGISSYEENGAINYTFNYTGYKEEYIRGIDDSFAQGTILALKVLPTHNILAAGNGNDSAYFMLMLKPNGNFDSSFALHGKAIRRVNYSNFVYDRATILDDNSVLFFTHSAKLGIGTADTLNLRAVKQNANGTPNLNFGVSGLLDHTYYGAHSYTPSTNLLVCDKAYRMIRGNYISLTPNTHSMVFTQFLANGLIDTSFGVGGYDTVKTYVNKQWQNRLDIHGMKFTKDEKRIVLISSAFPVSDLVRLKFIQPLTTSIIAAASEENVYIYPIPASGHIFVDIQGVTIAGYSIYDIQGRCIMQKEIKSVRKLDIPVSELPAGHYILQLQDDSGYTYSKKIIKD